MSTATRTTAKLPDHGTEYRYKGHAHGLWPGCRCDQCIHHHTRSCTLRALAHLEGRPPLYPAEPLVQHINHLMDAGMSRALIARRARVAAATVNYLARGVTKSCQRDKALRILAVTPNDFDEIALRPALASSRRVQALYVLGHNPQTIAAAADLDASTISHIANGRYRHVDARTAHGVTRAYRTLRHTWGTSAKAARIARTAGWAPAGAWADIDDPQCQPDTDTSPDPELNKYQLADVHKEEIQHLNRFGVPHGEIATRLGLEGAKDVRDRMTRWSRLDAKKAAIATEAAA